MEKHHNKRHHHWNNHNNKNQNNGSSQNNSRYEEAKPVEQKFHYVNHENVEAAQKREEAIQEFKKREVICPKCGEVITDLASAIADKTSGSPMHFECVMDSISAEEKLGPNEKICYIGQGRFGVLYFENPRDQRKFEIKKVIEWEGRDQKRDWRDEMSGLYSQVE